MHRRIIGIGGVRYRQEWTFHAYCAHSWGSVESYSYFIKCTYFVSFAFFTTDRHRGERQIQESTRKEYYWKHFTNKEYKTMKDCSKCAWNAQTAKRRRFLQLFLPSRPFEFLSMNHWTSPWDISGQEVSTSDCNSLLNANENFTGYKTNALHILFWLVDN